MLRKALTILCLPIIISLGACGVANTIKPVIDESSNTDEATEDDDTNIDVDAPSSADTDSTNTSEASPETPDIPAPSPGPTPVPTSPIVCPEWDTNPFTEAANDIGQNLSSAYEPSGAVWHASRGTLFVVSDEGILSELEADGSVLNTWTMGGDLEGVTVVPSKAGYVYLGFENPDSIAEFNLSTGLVTRTFALTTWMTGDANLGLEALTFVEDASLPNGGEFWAGHQGEGKIYIFDLPIVTSNSSTVVSFQTAFTPVSGRTDIADLNYDAENDAVLVLYDAANKLRLLDVDGNYLYEWTVPGTDQEGIAVLPDCSIVIAQDITGHPVLSYGRY